MSTQIKVLTTPDSGVNVYLTQIDYKEVRL